jgi:hypothetical protein
LSNNVAVMNFPRVHAIANSTFHAGDLHGHHQMIKLRKVKTPEPNACTIAHKEGKRNPSLNCLLAFLYSNVKSSEPREPQRETQQQCRFKDFPFFCFFFASPRALFCLIFFSTRIFIAHFQNYKMQFSDFFVRGREKKDVRRLLIISKKLSVRALMKFDVIGFKGATHKFFIFSNFRFNFIHAK